MNWSVWHDLFISYFFEGFSYVKAPNEAAEFLVRWANREAMNTKDLRKKVFSLFLVACATLAIILGFDATVHTTAPAAPPGTTMAAFVDSNPATNAGADQQVDGPRGTGSDAPRDGFTPILIPKDAYPKNEYNLQAIDYGGGVSLAPERPVSAPETPSDSVENKSPSYVPEPATMLLVGSGLISLAAFARKLKQR